MKKTLRYIWYSVRLFGITAITEIVVMCYGIDYSETIANDIDYAGSIIMTCIFAFLISSMVFMLIQQWNNCDEKRYLKNHRRVSKK